MSNDEIDSVEGRELDALIAEHLFGYVWLDPSNGINKVGMLVTPNVAKVWLEMGAVAVSRDCERYADWDHYIPKFSTTWDGAGLVIEQIKRYRARENGREIGINYINNNYNDFVGWSCDVGPANGFDHFYSGYADTASLAICRAALKAAMVGEEKA